MFGKGPFGDDDFGLDKLSERPEVDMSISYDPIPAKKMEVLFKTGLLDGELIRKIEGYGENGVFGNGFEIVEKNDYGHDETFYRLKFSSEDGFNKFMETIGDRRIGDFEEGYHDRGRLKKLAQDFFLSGKHK